MQERAMMGSWAEGREGEYGVWWKRCLFVRWFVWEKHRKRPRERFWGKGETFSEGRDWLIVVLGELGCFLSDVQDSWVGTLAESAPGGCTAGKPAKHLQCPCRIWHHAQKPVGEVVYTKKLNQQQARHMWACLWKQCMAWNTSYTKHLQKPTRISSERVCVYNIHIKLPKLSAKLKWITFQLK